MFEVRFSGGMRYVPAVGWFDSAGRPIARLDAVASVLAEIRAECCSEDAEEATAARRTLVSIAGAL